MKNTFFILLSMVSLGIMCSCNKNDDKDISAKQLFIERIDLGSSYQDVMNNLSNIENVTESDGNIYCYGVGNYKMLGYLFHSDTLETIVVSIDEEKFTKEDAEKNLLKGYQYIGLVKSVDTYVNEVSSQVAIISFSEVDNKNYISVAWSRYD